MMANDIQFHWMNIHQSKIDDIHHYSNLPIIFYGDFNARNPYWNDTITNRNGYKFKEVITDLESQKRLPAIRPAITYGYQIWGDKLIIKSRNKLDSIQHNVQVLYQI